MMIYGPMIKPQTLLISALTLLALGCGAPLAPSVPKLQAHTLQPNVQAPALIREDFRRAIGVRVEWNFNVDVCRGVSELITRSCKTRILSEKKSELLFEKNSETTRIANLKESFRLELEGLEGARDYEMAITVLNNDRDLAVTLEIDQLVGDNSRLSADKTLQTNLIPFPKLEVSGTKTKIGWDHRLFIWEKPALEVTAIELF
jgi:hypothetical protein